MDIDLSKYYYKEKWQGQRTRFDILQELWELHNSTISLCITKACFYLECNEKNIKMWFDNQSIKRMEMGKALHYLYQNDIDEELSKLRDDKFGWFPYHDERFEGAVINEWRFKEVLMTDIYKDKILYCGRLDELMMDSKGLFIQDIKSTAGFKYINNMRLHDEVQVNGYMTLSDRNPNPISIWAQREEQWRDVDKNIRRGRVKYVDMWNPLNTKVFEFKAKMKHFNFMKEQKDKFLRYCLHGELPEPNYDYLAVWECNPKYCPFSVKEGCPLDAHCKYSQWEEKK